MRVFIGQNHCEYEGEIQAYELAWNGHRIDLAKVERIEFDRTRFRSHHQRSSNLMWMDDGSRLDLRPRGTFSAFFSKSALKGHLVVHVNSLGKDMRFDMRRIDYLRYKGVSDPDSTGSR